MIARTMPASTINTHATRLCFKRATSQLACFFFTIPCCLFKTRPSHFFQTSAPGQQKPVLPFLACAVQYMLPGRLRQLRKRKICSRISNSQTQQIYYRNKLSKCLPLADNLARNSSHTGLYTQLRSGPRFLYRLRHHPNYPPASTRQTNAGSCLALCQIRGHARASGARGDAKIIEPDV